jgi:hypothetical protein
MDMYKKTSGNQRKTRSEKVIVAAYEGPIGEP